MTTITLTKDIEEWAREEVAAGRAQSVEALALKAIEAYRRQIDAFRRSLDDAEAESERDGWLDADEVFDELERRLS